VAMNGVEQRWLLCQSCCHTVISRALYLVQACGDVLCASIRDLFGHKWLTEWCSENLCQAFFMYMECVKEIHGLFQNLLRCLAVYSL